MAGERFQSFVKLSETEFDGVENVLHAVRSPPTSRSISEPWIEVRPLNEHGNLRSRFLKNAAQVAGQIAEQPGSHFDNDVIEACSELRLEKRAQVQRCEATAQLDNAGLTPSGLAFSNDAKSFNQLHDLLPCTVSLSDTKG